MKILFVTHYFQPHVGGIELVVYNEAKSLINRGHQVTIITSGIGKYTDTELIDGIKVTRVKAWNFLEERLDVPYPLFSPTLLLIIASFVKSCDVIHLHGALYQGSVIGAIFGKLFRKTVVTTEHVGSVKYQNGVLNLIENISFMTIGRLTLSLSDSCIVLNNNVFNYISKLTTKPVNVVNNGVDLTLFSPVPDENKNNIRQSLGLPVDKPLVLFVGRFVQKKGLLLLINAKDDSFNLVCVGSGNFPEHSKQGIYVFRNVKQKILARFYQASDVLVLPSHGEGFPLILQEAMASGLPILTSKENIPLELQERIARFIDLEETGIKESIKYLLTNDTLRKTLVTNASKVASDQFSWETHVERLQNIYIGYTKTQNANQ